MESKNLKYIVQRACLLASMLDNGKVIEKEVVDLSKKSLQKLDLNGDSDFEAVSEIDFKLDDIVSKIDIGVRSDYKPSQISYQHNIIASDLYAYPDSNDLPSQMHYVQELNKILEKKEALTERLHSYLFLLGSRVSGKPIGGYSDISFYDQVRLNVIEGTSEDETCRVAKFDFSGIQKFISRELKTQDEPSKKLRGRSTFISLLTEVLAQSVIEQLGLTPFHILFNSGGHCLFIVPSEKEESEVNRVLVDLSNRILNLFSGEIRLNHAVVNSTYDSLFNDYNQVYEELDEKLLMKKHQISSDEFETLFDGATFNAYQLENTIGQNESIIGTNLPKSIGFIVSKEKLKGFRDDQVLRVQGLDQYWHFCKDEKQLDSLEGRDGTTYIFNPQLEQIKFSVFQLAARPLFVGNYLPKKKDQVKTFEDLAMKYSEKDGELIKGYPLLGVIRLDVDDLGLIFTNGLEKLGDRPYHIGRLLMLSRNLSLFFTQEVNRLANDHEIYIGYSGGDDLFAVGNWKDIIKFGADVRKSFDRFSSNNPNFRASAGFAIVKSHYPISKATDVAAEMESEAKQASADKDRVALFGSSLTWGQLDICLNEGEQIVEALQNEEDEMASVGLLYSLLGIVKKLIHKRGKKLQVNRFLPNIYYAFARRGLDHSKIQEMKSDSESQAGKFATIVTRYFIQSSEEDGISNKEIRHQFNVLSHIAMYQYRNRKGLQSNNPNN